MNNSQINISNKFIIIPNHFVQTNKYTSEIVFIYALLQKNLTIRNQIIFTLSWLYKQLNIDLHNTYSRKRIINNLIKLEVDQHINYNCNINTINKNQLITANFIPEKKYFVKILDKEFDTINNCSNIDIYNLFCLFCNIKSRIDSKKYCYPSENELKKNNSINSDTAIVKYLKILKNLKLIDYANPGEIIINKNNTNIVTQSNNIYVLYNNRDILEDLIQHRKNEYNNYNIELVKRKENKISSNQKRSNAMKEYWRKKKGEMI